MLEFGIFLGMVATVVWAIWRVIRFFKLKVRKYGWKKVLATTVATSVGSFLTYRVAVMTYHGEIDYKTIMPYMEGAMGPFLVALALWGTVRFLKRARKEIRDYGWVEFLISTGAKTIILLTIVAIAFLLMAPIVLLLILYIFFTTKTPKYEQADVYGSYEWKCKNGMYDDIY